jgi:hypothetical protein
VSGLLLAYSEESSDANIASRPEILPTNAGQESWPDGHGIAYAGARYWREHRDLHGGLRNAVGATAVSEAAAAGDGVVDDSGVPQWGVGGGFHGLEAAGDGVPGPVCVDRQSFNIATKDQPEYISAMVETVGTRKMVGEPLFLGRYFLPEEGIEGKNHVVILMHKLWLKLGSNRDIIGQSCG